MIITIIVLLYLLNLIILKNTPLFILEYYICKYGFYFIMIPFIAYYIMIDAYLESRKK